jgi:transposase-like protein
MDLETDKILDFIVLQRGQVDGELEKQACDRLLSKFEAKGVKFKLFLSDRHMGIRCMMKQKYSHIEHQFDVWHLAKSLVKRLKSVDARMT